MTVTFLGTGTSQGVPVIGCECPVCTSEDPRDKRLRSSILVEREGKHLVVDTGPDFRYQMLREKVKTLDAVIFSHEHKDHIAGLDDVRAFNYRQGRAMDIYAHPRVQEALKRDFHYAFAEMKHYGIPLLELHDISKDSSFTAAGLEVQPIEVLHYKLPVLGFRFGDFSYITDGKTISPTEKAKLKGSKVLVLNALQKTSHISHFTLEEAISLAEEINAEQTYLTHISHLLGKHADVNTELPDGVALAYDGLKINF
ncbi:phosphoribosyl 1,2-cyclic phosphate phosphodiesterase [Arcticibacter pallidicorallinus]|uniref:Phosphoribosyl 1,2-cyclic phosphate phosphodiesterase n=1 Tax=Arcticibacter pallidicorallinus TaxID=1259464 RepID=A0A2T0UC61_9SPHI|nr:MBL fold metallo-hydrolase [Arcticibacter pallidicorallinus]PRY55482.1 phosphoribosyl 1,2-cyclic phosphate phosphodiesterase [Arcticibacter pallidicorallinus]